MAFKGRIAHRGDSGYEPWRNALPWQMYTAPRYPETLLRVSDASEIRHAVAFARKNNLLVAVRSGGHNVSGSFLRNGGLLIDLGNLQRVDVNETAGTAWVEPALWSHGLLKALEPHGYAFPVAHCATVPMGGYLLGGGLGYNHDYWGAMACDAVIAAEIVLANGETVVASAENHPELFWSVRGAGPGFFGIVKRFQLRLFPAPASVYEQSHVFPLSRLNTAKSALDSWTEAAPPNTELMMILAHNPAATHRSGLDSKVCIVRAATYADSETSALAIQRGLMRGHRGLDEAVTAIGPLKTSLDRMQKESLDAKRGLGYGRYAVHTAWTEDLSGVLGDIQAHFAGVNSEKTHYVITPKTNRNHEENTAFSRIGSAFVGAYAMWDEAIDDQVNFDWLSGARQLMQRRACGNYINEVDLFAEPQLAKQCYSDEAWRRLASCRKHYDPEQRFFRLPGH